MYDVDMRPPSKEFTQCWQAAGRHLTKQAQGGIGWLKANLTPPFLEHLSFRLGNQLHFVRIESIDGSLDVPGNREGTAWIAHECKGHACLMVMDRRGQEWNPVSGGWGLVGLKSRTPVDPVALISDELIEMTDWELHDMAVQVVRDQIVKEGRELMSSQGNPSVDPSIWLVGDRGPEWVVVRAVRYPARQANIPANLSEIARSCERLSKTGHFASVGIANSNDAFDSEKEVPKPLWRGHGMYIRYTGLEPADRK